MRWWWYTQEPPARRHDAAYTSTAGNAPQNKARPPPPTTYLQTRVNPNPNPTPAAMDPPRCSAPSTSHNQNRTQPHIKPTAQQRFTQPRLLSQRVPFAAHFTSPHPAYALPTRRVPSTRCSPTYPRLYLRLYSYPHARSTMAVRSQVHCTLTIATPSVGRQRARHEDPLRYRLMSEGSGDAVVTPCCVTCSA